ncbi:MAG TPA: carbohydrate binding domain-containing protein, partial [Bryobacteraceae bacterium]|nr:carbohydrate binding domain-containing protein [Bryobacteraceae bacterium]
RISNTALSDAAVAFDAGRSTPFADDEVLVSLAGVSPGELDYSVSGCGTATYNYPGIPITNFAPPSGLLTAGSTSVTITFQTLDATTCRYSTGAAADYSSMLALDTGPPGTSHQGIVQALSADPLTINRVYVRCESNSDFLQSVTYRAVGTPGGSYPRIGNIWIGDYVLSNAPDEAKKTQLTLGADEISAANILALRATDPAFLNIPAVNVTDSGGEGSPPDSYFLRDVHGNKIADWCGPPRYVLNVTRPEVAQFLAQYAYQTLAQTNFVSDGIFFDSFSTSISQPFTDCYGNSVQLDADGDGAADDPLVLNAAWSAGEYAIVRAFRALAPGAYVSGHVLESPPQTKSLAAFNGTSLEYQTQSVREGQAPFSGLWDLYQAWNSEAVMPAMPLIQACPPNQLSYGYGYYPLEALLPSTVAFAQSFYPNMRFGLALALMGDGFFGFDFGDESPKVTWWYDEYDFPLGTPTGPPVQTGAAPGANLLTNSGFESGLNGWRLNVTHDGSGRGTATVDSTVAADGLAAAHIAIQTAATVNWHIELEQAHISLASGGDYRVQFWARADSPRTITVMSEGQAANSGNYGLFAEISIGTSWNLYTVSFLAAVTADDGRLEFWLGDVTGDVWLDDVELSRQAAAVYRRDFTNGIVLLNGSAVPQTVSLEPGFQRFTGTQAPLYQYIVDDAGPDFSATGSWNTVLYNTGSWGPPAKNLPEEPQNFNGPFYHCWQGSCHQLDSGSGQAQWNLNIPADGQYSIQVWLPAAPGAANWTKSAVYEVVAGGSVVATATIDQTTAGLGDAWHPVATLNLKAADAPMLRVHNAGSGSLIADAVYLASSALYNDGSPASQVTLGAFDGILLQRQEPVNAASSRVSSVVNAASFQTAIASAGFVSIVGTGFGTSVQPWIASDFSGNTLPQKLDGVSVTVNGQPAFIEYVSPGQINAIAPDDATVGNVTVQVTTPQDASYSASVLKQMLSPAFFTYPSGGVTYAAAVHLDGTLAGPPGPGSHPAFPGETIEIYGTGFGATNPATPTADVVTQAVPLSRPAQVTIGGVNAQVQWAGIVSAGLYQLNVVIPVGAAGDAAVQATVSGFQTQGNVFLAIAAQ